ncbi:MAG: DUF563 domain-containing protein [Alphaproteobacteria bacterium]
MALKRRSVRHLRWLAARGMLTLLPALRRRVILYEKAIPAEDAGGVRALHEPVPLRPCPAEKAFLNRMPDPPGSGAAIERCRLPAEPARRVALIDLPDVTVLGNTGALVDEAGERLLLQRRRLPYATYHDFRPQPLRSVTRRGKPSLSFVGPWQGHRHLFHFLFDRVPKLYYALERFDLKDGDLEILVNEGLPPFQADFFRFLSARYPRLAITTVPARERWRFDRLLTIDYWQNVTTTVADEACLDWVRGLFLEGYGLRPGPARRRLWISRQDTRKRRLTNEAALRAGLAARGFEPLLLGTMAFRDQIACFLDAELVAGTHGAGFAHLLFAPAGSGVVELFPANRLRNTYALLSYALGHRHCAVAGTPGGPRERYSVDAGTVFAAVENMARPPARASGSFAA